mgnify:CR=1 FL=1
MINNIRVRNFQLAILLLVFGFVATVAATFLFFDDAFMYFNSPFKSISYEKVSDDVLVLDFETRFPAKSEVFYGTSPEVLNSHTIRSEFDVVHESSNIRVLPNKKHFFVIRLITPEGETHISDLLVK